MGGSIIHPTVSSNLKCIYLHILFLISAFYGGEVDGDLSRRIPYQIIKFPSLFPPKR